MTVKEKLDAIKNVEDYEVEISNKLEKIIEDTYDSHITCVNDFSVGDEYIEVTYDYTCRGYGDTDYVIIPRKWLDEGFDYKVVYEEMKRKAEEQRKKEETEEKRLEEKRKAKEEYEQYLKLKDKYEKNSQNFI